MKGSLIQIKGMSLVVMFFTFLMTGCKSINKDAIGGEYEDSYTPSQGDSVLNRFIHTSGKKIVDAKGNEVVFKGINLGGWMLQESYLMGIPEDIAISQRVIKSKIKELIGKNKTQEFYSKWLKDVVQKSDLDSVAKWGFNCVRVPLDYQLFTLPVNKEPVKGKNTWLDKGFRLLDSVYDWCASNQLYMIPCLFGTPGGSGGDFAISNGNPQQPILWESNANQRKMIALWKRIAFHYRNAEWIGGFNIMDEPNWNFDGSGVGNEDNNGCGVNVDNTSLRLFYIKVTKEIRKIDSFHMIIIDGNCWASNFNGLTPPWDNNMVYSFHKYWDENNRASIQEYLNIRDKFNVPIWDGESGENTNTWATSMAKLLKNHDVGWAWWPLKKVGDGNPFIVEMPTKYKSIINYWKGKGVRPSEEDAFRGLMNFANNWKTENLKVDYDMLHALLLK